MKDWLFASSLNSDDDIARLYNEEPGMWFHFVVGAPVVLTFNHSVRFLLANGTPAIMHSFGYYDESKHGRAAQLMRDTLGGETADLDEPPDFICVELDTTDVDLYRDVTVIPGKPVIAIPLDRGNGKGKWTTEMGTCSEWSEKRALLRVEVEQHIIDLAFCTTDYKFQGRSVDRIILSLFPSGCAPHLKVQGLLATTNLAFYKDPKRPWVLDIGP